MVFLPRKMPTQRSGDIHASADFAGTNVCIAGPLAVSRLTTESERREIAIGLHQFLTQRSTIVARFRRGEEETDGCSHFSFTGDTYVAIDEPHEGRYLRQS